MRNEIRAIIFIGILLIFGFCSVLPVSASIFPRAYTPYELYFSHYLSGTKLTNHTFDVVDDGTTYTVFTVTSGGYTPIEVTEDGSDFIGFLPPGEHDGGVSNFRTKIDFPNNPSDNLQFSVLANDLTDTMWDIRLNDENSTSTDLHIAIIQLNPVAGGFQLCHLSTIGTKCEDGKTPYGSYKDIFVELNPVDKKEFRIWTGSHETLNHIGSDDAEWFTDVNQFATGGSIDYFYLYGSIETNAKYWGYIKNIRLESILGSLTAWPDTAISDDFTSHIKGIDLFNYQTVASGTETYIQNFGTKVNGLLNSTADPDLSYIKISSWDANDATLLVNSTSTINKFLAGQLTSFHFHRIDEYAAKAGHYPVGLYKFEISLCSDAAGTNCRATTTEYLIFNETVFQLIDEQSFEDASAAYKDAMEHDVFDDIWGIGSILRDAFNSIIAKFPFSWIYEINTIWRNTAQNYHGSQGADSAEGFTVGWTMPADAMIMAGEEFTVLDFEEAYDRWGDYFVIFRNIFTFVLYLSLIMVVWSKTKQFFNSLREES